MELCCDPVFNKTIILFGLAEYAMINNQLGEAPRWLFIIAYSALPHRIIVKYTSI